MSGTLIIRPVEAKLTHDNDMFSKMDPYCVVLIGGNKVKGQVCHSGGKNPHWNDAITVQRSFEPVLYVELKDKDILTPDGVIGIASVDLNAISTSGSSTNWYPVYHKKLQVGEILLKVEFNSDRSYKAQGGQYGQIQDPFTISPYLNEHIVPPSYGQTTYSQKTYQGSNYGQGEPMYGQSNVSFGQSGSTYTQAGAIYDQDRPQYRQGDVYSQGGIPYEQQGGAYNQGGVSYGQQEQSYSQGGISYGQQGGAYNQGGVPYGQQGGVGFGQNTQSNFDQYGNT